MDRQPAEIGLGRDGIIREVNQESSRLLGILPASLTGREFAEALTGLEDRAAFRREVRDATLRQECPAFAAPRRTAFLRADGGRRPMDWTLSVDFRRDPPYRITFWPVPPVPRRDVLKALLGTLEEEAVALLDETGRLTPLTPAAERLFAGVFEVHPGEGDGPWPLGRDPWNRALKGDSFEEDVLLRSPRSPGGVSMRLTVRPLCGENGAPHGAVFVGRDITPLLDAQRLLRAMQMAAP